MPPALLTDAPRTVDLVDPMIPELCNNAEIAGRLRAYAALTLDVDVADTLLTAADRLVDGSITLEV